MNSVMVFLLLAAQVLLSAIRYTEGQVPMELNPSFHRISYRVGPDGRTNMGGHGDELNRFFNGLGSERGRAGFRNSGAIAGSGGAFRPRVTGRRWQPMRRWSFFRTF